MPSRTHRLSPITYTTIPLWAPLISCPPDCRGYENRTVAWVRAIFKKNLQLRTTGRTSDDSPKATSKWDWKFWLGVILIPVALAILALLQPEVRSRLGLDKPKPAVVPSNKGPQPQTASPVSSAPSSETKTQQGKPTAAKGATKSGAASKVSQPNPVTQINAPQGIAIGGNATVNNPTVNNYLNSKPQPRRLTKEQQDLLVPCLKAKTGTFIIGALVNNAEAYRYALDFSEVFSEAGWKNDWAAPVASIMIGGGMWSGVHVTLPALTYDSKKQQATFVDPSPETTALNCLDQAKIVAALVPQTDKPSGSIRIDVSENP